MQNHNWKEILENTDTEELEEVLEILEKRKILLDEDGTFISKIMLKEGHSLLVKFLRENGYVGSLEVTGKYYDFHGEVMALYDEAYFDEHSEVEYYLDQYVNDKKGEY